MAIKILDADGGSRTLHARFLLERDRLRVLEHPYIPRLLGVGETSEGAPFYVMDFVDGEPIDAYADRLRLSVRERLDLLLRVGEAVSHAHAHAVVHRDLKPSNVLVRASGEPALLDFGIAKLLDPVHHGEATDLTLQERAYTPGYASPEQVLGEPVSEASDVYSLGAVGYRLVAGRPPGLHATQLSPARVFEARREESKRELAALRSTTPAELSALLQGAVGSALQRACAVEPGGRYGSIEELARELRVALDLE